MNYRVEAHKTLVSYLHGSVNYRAVGDGDLFSEFNGAAHQAVKDNAILDVALIADDNGMRLVCSQGYAWSNINLLADAHVAYKRCRVIHIR
jgi:hypothetical protein